MLQVFWGFILLLFDINVSVYGIDILPDFIGWILAVYGLNKLSQHTKIFTCVKIVGILMIFASLLQFVISFMGIADSSYILTNAFWGLKLAVLTLLIFALYNVRERLGNIQRIKSLGAVWLAILIIEISTLLYNSFIIDYLPNAIQKAIMQILVVGVIFFKIWFIFGTYKIKKHLKDVAV